MNLWLFNFPHLQDVKTCSLVRWDPITKATRPLLFMKSVHSLPQIVDIKSKLN